MQPTAEYLLRLLADLYADQCGVKVTVEIKEPMEIEERNGIENEDYHSSEQARIETEAHIPQCASYG